MKCLVKEKLSEHKYRDNNGYLICVDSVLARTGKQTYLRSEIFNDAADDDSEIEVDRKPEEVFSEKTLASFENCPLCVEHPNEDVNPENYKEYAVGFVRDVHKGIDNGQDVILGTLVITDAKTIEEIENGEHTDLSCGYDCDIDDSANPQQRNIRGNHVALCEQGRAGNARIVDTAEKVNDYQTKEVSRKRVEEVPTIGRNLIRKENWTPGSALIAIKGHLEDIIEAAEPEIREELKFKADKIIKDLKGQFNITDSINDGQYKLREYPQGFAILPRRNYNQYGINAYVDRICNSLDEARRVRSSFERADGIDFVIVDCNNNKLVDSIKDVNPREGESKEDFISRFMSETKGEYPDEKQRLAVAYSYWEKRNMKDKEIKDVNFNEITNFIKKYYPEDYKYNHKKEHSKLENDIDKYFGETVSRELLWNALRGLNSDGYLMFVNDSMEDAIYTIQQHNGKWYYEIKEDNGFAHLVGPYTSAEEAISYFKKHRPNEKLSDEETTAEEVTKHLEKNFENFKESRMEDDSDLTLLREYFNERQPSRKIDLRTKLKSMGYEEGISGVNSRELLWVKLNGKRYEVKNLSSVKPLDSVKDSTFVVRYKDLYHNEAHEEDIKANSIGEAVEELKKRVVLRGIGTANVYVNRIENTDTKEYYPKAFGKLNSLTVDSVKFKDAAKTISNWVKTKNGTPVLSAILERPNGYTFYSAIVSEDKDFDSLDEAEKYAKQLGYTKDSLKKDSLINIVKVIKALKK